MNRRARDPADLAVVLSAALTEAHVPHSIGGAVAYGFWGNPRGTVRWLDALLAAVPGPR